MSEPSQTTCPNCGAVFTGNYCWSCGQKRGSSKRSLGEIVGEFIEETFSLDSKLAQTIAALLWRPGRISHAYWEGQRTRYSSPFKIYVTSALIAAVVLALTPIGLFVVNLQIEPAEAIGWSEDRIREAMTDDALSLSLQVDFFVPLKELSANGSAQAELRVLDTVIDARPERPFVNAVVDGLREGITAPYVFNTQVNIWFSRFLAAFVLVMTLFFAVLYPRRYLVQHLVFAVHLQAFIGLAMSAACLMAYVTGLANMVAFGFFVALSAVYTLIAMRRAYGNSWLVTVFKFALLFLAYAQSMMLAAPGVMAIAGWTMA